MRVLSVVLYFSVLLCIVSAALDCGSHGDLNVVADGCICRSGYDGADCTNAPAAGCPAQIAPPTEANNFPKLSGEISFTGNTLHAAIVGPYVNNRKYTGLQPTGTSTDACKLGTTAGHWGLTFDDTTTNVTSSALFCTDVFALTLPWTDHADCGFEKSLTESTDSQAVYTSRFQIDYVDDLGAVSGVQLERPTSLPYQIWVSFPTKVVAVLENLKVSSVLEIDAGLTSAKYNPDTQVLTYELTTVINWPNMIYGDLAFVLPDTMTQEGDADLDSAGTCLNNAGTKCVQRITFGVKLVDSRICTFNGVYNVSATVTTCRENGGVACGSTTTSTLQFSLSTQNVCGQVSTNPPVNGELHAYTSNAFDTRATTFNLGSNSFFKVDLTTQNTVSLTFSDIYFNDGTIPSTNKYLLKATSATVGTVDQATKALINVDNTNNNFQVYFASQVFAIPPYDTVTYTFTAIANVVFQGNKKRTVMMTWAAGQQTLNTNAQVQIINDAGSEESVKGNEESTNTINAGAVAGGVVGALAALALIGTVSVYIIKKRKAPRAPVPDSAADASTGAAQSPVGNQV